MKRVIKIGGRAQASARFFQSITTLWNTAPASFCLVHGGGDEISAFQRRIGASPTFVNGRRVTTKEDVAIVRMVLSGLVNKRLVLQLAAAGVPAVGISGEDGSTLTATRINPSLGFVGAPADVNVRLIQTLLDESYLPVISPLAGEKGGEDGEALNVSDGEALNVNGDDAAAAIAIALGASELLFVADVEGVLDDNNQLMSALERTEAMDLAQRGVINGGMRAKLEAGFAALAAGVERVRISAIEGLSNPVVGTVLSMEQSLIP